jgi:hypothetical protein
MGEQMPSNKQKTFFHEEKNPAHCNEALCCKFLDITPNNPISSGLLGQYFNL